MKRKNVTKQTLHQAAVQSTRESAALENRAVPPGFARSARVEQFLSQRKLKV